MKFYTLRAGIGSSKGEVVILLPPIIAVVKNIEILQTKSHEQTQERHNIH